MKIKIYYSTREKNYKTANTFQYVGNRVELEPVRIIRNSCGRGAAASRYHYIGVFVAPEDAAFISNGEIRENIHRKTNPKFNPKNYKFTNNVAVIAHRTDQ